MKSRDFCYWLQGLFEVGNVKELNAAQVEIIRKHLNMVFIHEIDPSFPAEQQQALDDAHGSIPIKQTTTGWYRGLPENGYDDFPEPGMKC